MSDALRLQIFDTKLGMFLLAWQEESLVRLQYGDRAGSALQELVAAGNQVATSPNSLMRKTSEKLTRFAAGQSVALDDIALDMRERTSFQIRTLCECRRIPWGSVVSYGELACRIGRPRAARAVGSVMRSNRHPLIIPCHRVVAANGELGGYSADDGLATKARLLFQEGIRRYYDAMELG